MVHCAGMQKVPVVDRLRRGENSSRRRFLTLALAALSLLATLLALPPQSAAAQPAVPVARQTKTDPNPAQPAETIAFTTLRAEQGLLSVALPSAWDDIAQGEWQLSGAPAGRKWSASPNQADFAANWGTPGISIYYSTSLPAAMDAEDLLAVFDFASVCQDGGRGTLPPAQRTVIYQIWQQCAGSGTAAAVLVIYPTNERDFYAVVEIYLTAVDDLRALGPILSSLQIGGGAPQTAGEPSQPAAEPAESAAEATAAPTAAAPAPTATPTVSPVTATVLVDRLNLRSGPSTTVERLTVVTRGMQVSVQGQIDNCAWLRVTAPDGQQGWVSGDPQFVSLDTACAAVPAAENP